MSRHFPNKHPKQPRDFYPTPLASVLPLVPHLKAARVREFCEPCCGEGDLIRHLEAHGLRCVYAGDIATGQDALGVEQFAAPVITNTPFSRGSTPLLLALIRHFTDRAPCAWLLLPVDQINTDYMKPFLPLCSHIVVAGRDQWLQNGGTGSTDLGWYRFDRSHASGPIFHHGNLFMPDAITRRCGNCGAAFHASRTDAQFCSPACRQRAYRSRLAVT